MAAALVAVHPFLYRYRDAAGVERSLRLTGEREDRGGSEGYTGDQQVGGRWERVYRVYADAFPLDAEGVRVEPQENATVLDGLDDAELAVSAVELVSLPPFPGVWALTCRRTKVKGGVRGAR